MVLKWRCPLISCGSLHPSVHVDCGVWDNHHENDVYELMFMLMNASQHLPILYMHQVVRTNELHIKPATATAKSLQSCPTLCDPRLPHPGILQPRTLEWVAISFSNAWKWKVKVKSLSRVWLFETPWTAAHQAPPFMGFSRQEYWSGMPSHKTWPTVNAQ